MNTKNLILSISMGVLMSSVGPTFSMESPIKSYEDFLTRIESSDFKSLNKDEAKTKRDLFPISLNNDGSLIAFFLIVRTIHLISNAYVFLNKVKTIHFHNP